MTDVLDPAAIPAQPLPAPRWRPWLAVSGSQVSNFDVAKDPQTACERRWALEKIFGRKPPEKAWQRLGTDLHAMIEGYYLRNEPVTSGIVKAGMSYWPARSPDIRVEQWFALEIPGWADDRAKQVTESGWPIGYGRWTGRSDLLDMSGKVPLVIDFKNLASLSYAKHPEQLASSAPMISYAYWALTHSARADSVVLKHIVNETRARCPACKKAVSAQTGRCPELLCTICCKPQKGDPYGPNCDLHRHKNLPGVPCNAVLPAPKAKEVRVELSRADIQDRWNGTIETVHRMRSLSVLQDWRDFTANKLACRAYGGCPHRDLCYGTAAFTDAELPPGPPGEFIPSAAYTGDETMAPSPELSGLFIGLNQIFSSGKMPDAQTCTQYAEALKTHAYRPETLPLLPDGQAILQPVLERMSAHRAALIGILHGQIAQGEPDDRIITCLRPLQGLYATLAQAAQQGKLNPAQVALFNLMRHEHEDAVMAALRARKERQAAQQVQVDAAQTAPVVPPAPETAALAPQAAQVQTQVQTASPAETAPERPVEAMPQGPQSGLWPLWVLTDCITFIKDVGGKQVINGNTYMQQWKEYAAAEYVDKNGRRGVMHYREIGYGAGPMTVVTYARDALLKTLARTGVIIHLESQDETQAELARSLSGIAEVYIRGTRQ